jgi:DNA-binding NarL/FixJ family response regulator
MKRITVSPADDHSVVREVFPRMLELEGDFGVVGEAAEGRQRTKSSASGFG